MMRETRSTIHCRAFFVQPIEFAAPISMRIATGDERLLTDFICPAIDRLARRYS